MPKLISTTCSKCGTPRDLELKKRTSLCRSCYNKSVAVGNARRRGDNEYRGADSKKWLTMPWVRVGKRQQNIGAETQ